MFLVDDIYYGTVVSVSNAGYCYAEMDCHHSSMPTIGNRCQLPHRRIFVPRNRGGFVRIQEGELVVRQEETFPRMPQIGERLIMMINQIDEATCWIFRKAADNAGEELVKLRKEIQAA